MTIHPFLVAWHTPRNSPLGAMPTCSSLPPAPDCKVVNTPQRFAAAWRPQITRNVRVGNLHEMLFFCCGRCIIFCCHCAGREAGFASRKCMQRNPLNSHIMRTFCCRDASPSPCTYFEHPLRLPLKVAKRKISFRLY